MEKMDPVIKTQWVTALRSGEYRQGWNFLNSGGKFCCLGVLCEVAIKEGLPLTVTGDSFLEYDKETQFLPLTVAYWAKFPSSWDSDALDKLIRMNDGGSTFKQIADWIEVYL